MRNIQYQYRYALLGVLTSILAFNFVDRVALGLLLPAIQLDLRLSDSELGLLSGISFALFYSAMGFPIARWADRGNRVTIITITTLLWSIAVACCGFARSFLQLMLVRIGVAVGEAGCTPPAFSLIADYFDRTERSRAVAIYGLGVPLGTILGCLCGGWLNQAFGWRATFVVLGAPGILLAVLAGTVLLEPRSTSRNPSPWQSPLSGVELPKLYTVFSDLFLSTTFRHLLAYACVQGFFGYGILTWLPTFLLRSYGVGSAQGGLYLALTYGIGGLVGSLLGGECATRWGANNERRQLKMMAVAVAGAGLASVAAYSSHNIHVTLGGIAIGTLGLTFGNAPMWGTMQTLVAPNARATAIALVYFVVNLLGLGMGPLVVGLASDVLKSRFGAESLRYTLIALALGYFWSAYHAWWASRTVMHDLQKTSEAISEGCFNLEASARLGSRGTLEG